MTTDAQQQAKQGVIFALLAYFMWGVAPVYFKFVEDVSPFIVICHRIIWSFVLLSLLIYFTKSGALLKATLKSKSKMIYLTCTSVIIGGNWLVYIWAIGANHMIDASLGYFINPLFNIVLGMVFLNERLRKLQWFAVALAAIGVGIQLFIFGEIPIVAFTLAITFGAYGLLRKKVKVDAYTGLFIETLILLPFAVIYLLSIRDSIGMTGADSSLSMVLLLVISGIVTTLPLLCFSAAANRLQLGTIGFLQYIGPTIMLLLAVLVYNEPFTSEKLYTFSFIWVAVLLFSWDAISANRQSKKALIKESDNPTSPSANK